MERYIRCPGTIAFGRAGPMAPLCGVTSIFPDTEKERMFPSPSRGEVLDALSDFKALLHDFRGVSLWAVGGGLAVPFAAALADLAPPWPPGIVGVTAVVELLTLV